MSATISSHIDHTGDDVWTFSLKAVPPQPEFTG
jgi:hypothetical protein